MAVQPAPAPVLALTPQRTDDDVAGLMLALDTERSAGKALLAALSDLEANLAAERRRVIDLEVDRAKLQDELDNHPAAVELDRQRKVTTGLFAQLEEARASLEDERTKTFLRRLFNR